MRFNIAIAAHKDTDPDEFYASLVEALGTITDTNFVYTIIEEHSNAGISNH